MKIIEVKGSEITHSQSVTNGFYQTFYILYNSFISTNEQQRWNSYCDIMAVLGTNGLFALELYLNFFMVITSFDPNTCLGRHNGEQHDLKNYMNH